MTDGHPSTTRDDFAFPWMAIWQGPQFWSAYGSCARATEPVVRSAACAQLEVSSLVGHRMKAWAGIPSTLARCRTPVDLFQAQVAFWQEAGRNYMEASQHVMEAWRGVLPAGFAEAVGEAMQARDYITFPEPRADAAAEERRRPGETRRAA